MGIDGLPVAVRRLIEGKFDTISSLEVLLILHDQPARRWSGADVARALRLDETQAAGILAELGRKGLARRVDHGFEYAPSDPGVAAAVAMLAECYGRYRWRITGVIFAKHSPNTGP